MDEQIALLLALQQGCMLKVHRTLDGAKTYRLHAIDNQVLAVVPTPLVTRLEQRRLIQSNMKFPVAVFSLTAEGHQAAQAQAAAAQVSAKKDR